MFLPTSAVLVIVFVRGPQMMSRSNSLRGPQTTRCSISATDPVLIATSEVHREVVSDLLQLIDGTDRGVAATIEQRSAISTKIIALEESWQNSSALEQPNKLFRYAEVAYVGQSSSVRANAAGGKYRGSLGRLLCPTDALFQHLLAEGAFNVIHFRLLGLVPGAAILQGAWRPASSGTIEELRRRALEAGRPAISDNLLTVDFEAPRIAFGREGRVLSLRFGPTSSVQLDTTYLDDRIRIARGGTSGTPFVLRMDTCDGSLAAAAIQYQRAVSRTPLGKRTMVPALMLCASAAWRIGSSGSLWRLWGTGMRLSIGRLLAVALLAAALAVLRSTGGIVEERSSTAAS